jgi:lysophospholipase L1-like esterase
VRLLVLGDSLSDGGWKRDPEGIGTAWPRSLRDLAALSGGSVEPRVGAIAGSRSTEMLAAARELAPGQWDAAVLFAGANDAWRRWVPWGGQDPVDEDDFRRNLRQAAGILREKGAAEIWILTPCLLDADPDHPWNEVLRGYREACREAAELAGSRLVPTGEEFEAAVRARPEIKWTYDGAHPRPVGQERLAWTIHHRMLGGPALPEGKLPPRPAGTKVRTWP